MRSVIDTMDHLVTGPVVEPLDLEEVKKQRRFSSTTLDTLFDLWIAAARQWFEEYTGRQTMLATRELWLGGFPSCGVIELPHPPLQEVVSVKYGLEGDDELTLDAESYIVMAPAGERAAPGRVALVDGASWPTMTNQPKGVRIRYTCGYGSATGDVPELVKAGLFWLVGHFHKYGEAVQDGQAALQELPLGVKAIFDGLKYTALPTLPPPSAWPTYQGTSWPV